MPAAARSVARRPHADPGQDQGPPHRPDGRRRRGKQSGRRAAIAASQRLRSAAGRDRAVVRSPKDNGLIWHVFAEATGVVDEPALLRAKRTMTETLKITNLHVSVEDTPIL